MGNAIDAAFKIQIEIDDTQYFINTDELINHPQWISIKQLLEHIENNKYFRRSSIKLFHKDGYIVNYNGQNESNDKTLYFHKNEENMLESNVSESANSLEAYNNPFPCEPKDKELLIRLIDLVEIHNLDEKLRNITLRNCFNIIKNIMKFTIEVEPNPNIIQTILRILPKNLPNSYESTVCESATDISIFHLAIQTNTIELVKILFDICNTNKDWLTNEIRQGQSRKESHIVSALITNNVAIIDFILSIIPVSENDLSSIEESIMKLPLTKRQQAISGLGFLVEAIAEKKELYLKEAIKNNDIQAIESVDDISSYDIKELIKFALKHESNEAILIHITQQALKFNINGNTLTFLLINNLLADEDKFIEKYFAIFSIKNIFELLSIGKISKENCNLIFNLPIEKIYQDDLLPHIAKAYPDNEMLINFIQQTQLNQITYANHIILLPLMLAYKKDTDKVVSFIKENKYDLPHLLLISMLYKKDDKTKKIFLEYLNTFPSMLNKFDLLLAKNLDDPEIYNKLTSVLSSSLSPSEMERAINPLTIDLLDEIKKYRKVLLTKEIKEALIKIRDICNLKYYDQSFYGNDALNRQMLLDSEIAKLLTPEVIIYIFTNKSIPEAKIKRNSTGLISLRDALYSGFKNGLHVIHRMPNNESSYGLANYRIQDSNFIKNTMKIVNNICLAAGISQIEQEKKIDAAILIKQFDHIVETVNLIKTAQKLDFLLFVPSYTPEEILRQTKAGFKKLTTYIDDLNNETLESFCDKILNNPEAMLDGTVIHLFYDRVHLEAALVEDTLFHIGENQYALQDVLSAMIRPVARNPNSYLYAQEQLCLRLNLVENHLKNKFKPEYEQATKNLYHSNDTNSSAQNKVQSNSIYAGPLNKTKATFELECLIQGLLIASKENRAINVTFNEHDEMIISVENENIQEVYNLTHILKGEPNWEHLNIGPTEITNYEYFLQNLNNPPIYPHIEKFKEIDISQIKIEFPQLSLAECSAIYNYTSNLYSAINRILRFNGQADFLNTLDNSTEIEFSSMLANFNNRTIPNPGEYPSKLHKLVVESILTSAFASHALIKPFWYDRMIIAASLEELQKNLKTLSGFLIGLIGEGDHKQIAVIQHGHIINFDDEKNLPTLNFKQFYSKLKSIDKRSLLSFSSEDLLVIQQSLNTQESYKLISFGSLELDNRFLGCLIQEIGDENVYPLKEIYRADRNNLFMDSYTLSIVDTLTKEGQAHRITQGFYSTSEELQDKFFHKKPGVVTKLVFPSGTVFRVANLSKDPDEKEYLLPPGQQLLYTYSEKNTQYRELHAKPIRSVQNKEPEKKSSDLSIYPGVGKALNTFGLLNKIQTLDVKSAVKKNEDEKENKFNDSTTPGDF